MQKLPARIDDLLTCHGRARETAFERSSSARHSKPLPALGPIWWSNPNKRIIAIGCNRQHLLHRLASS